MRQIRPIRGAAAPVAAAVLHLAAALLAAGPAVAQTPPPPRPVPDAALDATPAPDPGARALFEQPALNAALQAAVARAEAGDLEGAARALEALIARDPGAGDVHAARAAVALLRGDRPAALAGLEAAAAPPGPAPVPAENVAALLADPLFASLAADPALAPRVAALAARPAPPPPAPPVPAPLAEGRAPVTAANTRWNPGSGRLEARFTLPTKPWGPVAPARKVAAYEILRDRAKAGRAAGNTGDLYDNRDRGHSVLDPALNPQLARTDYAPEARAADIDYGLADRILFDRPTLGNSSTALTGPLFWRSLPRQAMTQSDGAGPFHLWQTAAANALYVYPAHKDFGPEAGDLFPANLPYILVSRGSSGSDRPFLEAVALAYAALRPETKAKAVDAGLLVPTVQMIFRRSLRNVTSRAAYLSGDAHPAAFEGFQINAARMVSLAGSIAPDALPAEVRIRVESEELGLEGIDFFGQGLTEQLFDTPAAIGRIWRSQTGRRTMVISAADSRDVNGRPLTFTWALLQGETAKVRIEPLDGGSRARITLDWHDPFRISEDVPLLTSRVDIGAFASNGVHDSAPAILSWYFPPDATRSWQAGPDGPPRLAAIDHRRPAAGYVDPALFPAADWADDLHRDADGRLTGWTRRRDGRPAEEFDATGRRRVGDGTIAVVHAIRRTADGRFALEEQDAPPE